MSIKRLLQLSPPPLHPSPLPGFHQVCLLFYKKYFINYYSYKFIEKIMRFKEKQILPFNLLLVGFDFAVLCDMCIMCSWGAFSQFCHHETMNSLMSAYMRNFLFVLSSNHVAQQKNSCPWFENFKLLFFVFRGN